MVSEATKKAGTFLAGSLAAYAGYVAAQAIDSSVKATNPWLRPSTVVAVGGAIGFPLLAIYSKGSERTKMIELGAAAYFIPQAIQIARTMATVTSRVSFRPSYMPAAMPTYVPPAAYSVGSTIF